MRTVKEVSKLTGVSVRTLHHYDSIGLLKPTAVTESGYRLYDDTALTRLQNILLFRELQFPLKDIKEILDNPDFVPEEALAQQIHLLELKRKRLDELISFALEIQKKGVNSMNFQVFDNTEAKQYAAEVKERWGNTKAYEEYQEKTAGQSPSASEEAAAELMLKFSELGALKHLSPGDKQVQNIIKKLQESITEHYYTCTDDILKGLGQMYVNDERMRQNIDKAGSEGTAEFAAQAIEAYCTGK